MSNNSIYNEKISSTRTEALFLALTLLFSWLFTRRAKVGKWGFPTTAFFCLFLFFLFYTLNYRTLIIHLNSESLELKFGVFSWRVPLANIAKCRLDEIPSVMKYGGAGIHFMSINNQYRASFNFLEYPRAVLTFKKKVGPVRELSFSTRQPEDVLRLIQEAIVAPQNVIAPT